MESNFPRKLTVAQRLKHELLEYALLSTYLYICFGALIVYKILILHGEGVSFAPYGLAAIKALVLGKFILLGHAVRLGDGYESQRVLTVIIQKSVLYLVFLVALTIVEEAIIGLVHGQSITTILAEFGREKLLQMVVQSLIMLLILIPYLASSELNVVLGEGRLWKIMLTERTKFPSKGQSKQH
jgi:hypothetical protein